MTSDGNNIITATLTVNLTINVFTAFICKCNNNCACKQDQYQTSAVTDSKIDIVGLGISI